MGVLAERLKARLASEKNLVFDRYTERQRRAGVGSTTFNLDLNSSLSCREAVMKNKYNMRGLSRLLNTFNLGCEESGIRGTGYVAQS